MRLMPSSVFPEIRLPAPATGPPMVSAVAWTRSTPSTMFGTDFRPDESVPMSFQDLVAGRAGREADPADVVPRDDVSAAGLDSSDRVVGDIRKIHAIAAIR